GPAALISHDLSIRKHQASIGVSIAQAGVDQAELDAVYAVKRTYFTVLYARAQLQVADDVATSLKFYQERVRDSVKKGEGPKDWSDLTVDKITVYLRLAENRRAEAAQGVERAQAALREAIGACADFAFQVAEGPLPEPKPTLNHDEL